VGDTSIARLEELKSIWLSSPPIWNVRAFCLQS